MTDAQMRNQVIWNEIAFNDILGFFPTYYRLVYYTVNIFSPIPPWKKDLSFWEGMCRHPKKVPVG